jgi:hypothetical protein
MLCELPRQHGAWRLVFVLLQVQNLYVLTYAVLYTFNHVKLIGIPIISLVREVKMQNHLMKFNPICYRVQRPRAMSIIKTNTILCIYEVLEVDFKL